MSNEQHRYTGNGLYRPGGVYVERGDVLTPSDSELEAFGDSLEPLGDDEVGDDVTTHGEPGESGAPNDAGVQVETDEYETGSVASEDDDVESQNELVAEDQTDTGTAEEDRADAEADAEAGGDAEADGESEEDATDEGGEEESEGNENGGEATNGAPWEGYDDLTVNDLASEVGDQNADDLRDAIEYEQEQKDRSTALRLLRSELDSRDSGGE